MGNFRAVLFVSAVSFVAACGDDGGKGTPDAPVIIHTDAAPDAPPDAPPPPDAPNYDFSCMGNAAPTTATPTVTIGGQAQEVDVNFQTQTPSITPKDGVVVKACIGDCTGGNLKDTETTAGGGNFTTTAIDTGGTPVDGYVDATSSGDKRTLVFPASPITANLANVPLLILSNNAFQAIGLVTSTTVNPADGHVVIAVTDCAGTAIDGATITVKQNGNDVPGTSDFDLGLLSSMAAGTHAILNVPPGPTEVGATYSGHTLRAHTVTVIQDAITESIVRPGY